LSLSAALRLPVSGQPDKEFVFVSIEWPAERVTPPHTHLGDEYGTVGSYIVKQGDNEAKTYNAGESWHVPAGVVHESKNAAPITKTMNTFIVEKDKPLIRLGDPRFGGESRPTHTRTKSFKEDRRALSRHALGRSILNIGIDGPFVFRRGCLVYRAEMAVRRGVAGF
jgi:quercetin dioxygenase-like cupin family protein